MKREAEVVETTLARFTKKVVTHTQITVVGNPDPAVQKGNGGYADWVILSIHSLRKYLDHPYRLLLDVLHEMPHICSILGLEVSELPDFSTACARMQTLKMPVWRRYLELSAKLHETGEIQAIDATGMDRIEKKPPSIARSDGPKDARLDFLHDDEKGGV